MSSESDSFLRRQKWARPKWAVSLNNDLDGLQTRHKWIFGLGALWIVLSLVPIYHYFNDATPAHLYNQDPHLHTVGHTTLPNALLLGEDGAQLTPSEYDDRRLPDLTDGFKDFAKHENCNFSSLDLHAPFAPLCSDRKSLLEAMSGGGRIGVDAPYTPLGCDMRWFTTEELCTILSKFEKVLVIGDSLMRNVATAAHVLLREDLWEGAWNRSYTSPEGITNCYCGAPIAEHSNCSPWPGSASSSSSLWQLDPNAMKCPRESTAPIELVPMFAYPIVDRHKKGFKQELKQKKPPKPYAFVFGTAALWMDLKIADSKSWVDQVFEFAEQKAPYLKESNTVYSRLFVSPSASGPNKPEQFWAHQGNIALARFEKELGQYVSDKGMDFLGTFNLTIQTNNPDGTHGTYASTLTKAMMVFNWLNTIDTDAW